MSKRTLFKRTLSKRTPFPLVTALVALGLLAMSVARTTLHKGRSLNLVRAPRSDGSRQSAGIGDYALLLFRLAIGAALVGALVGLILALVTGEGRRRLLRLLSLLIVLMALMFILPIRPLGGRQVALRSVAAGTVAPRADSSASKARRPWAPPDWLPFAVIAALALAVAAAAARSYRQIPVPNTAQSPIDALGANAQDAADALRRGAAVGETIQRCYLEMCSVIAQERGIERSAAMTPNEFEVALRSVALPGEAVSTLTGLFEESRYGGSVAGPEMQAKAIESLAAACRR